MCFLKKKEVFSKIGQANIVDDVGHEQRPKSEASLDFLDKNTKIILYASMFFKNKSASFGLHKRMTLMCLIFEEYINFE